MAQALFKNNAFSTLASGINTSVTSITVAAGDGALFPAPTDGNYFYVTLIDTSNNLEIVKCTARSTDALTVVRAQESTTARAYSSGDRIELRVTGAGLTDVVTTAAASATAAASSAAASAASFDSFDDRFLGAKSSAPSTDNDSAALVVGALYFNTSDDNMYVRNAANNAWLTVNNTVASALATAYAVKVDGVAAGSDHSAKAWAVGGTGVTDTSSKGAAKEWATETSGTVDGTSYSAKEYAAGTQGSTGGSAKDWAQDANQVNGASTNDRSAKAWAQGASMTGSTLGGSSKDWAQVTGGTVDGSDYSAKEYSIGTTATSAKTYATKIDGAVTGSDFSSKAWAIGGTNVTSTGSRGAAKEWATTTGAAVDTSEFSSKEYALGTTLTTGSSKQWALGGGSSFTEGTAVAGGVFSAKKYAANAAASASLAASGQLYSTVVNQTGATLSPALSADGTYYLCDTSSNNITVTLPAIGSSEGVKYAFQKTHASNSLIFARSGSDTLNGSASNITITDVNAQIQFVSDDNSPDNWVGVNLSQITVGSGLSKTGSVVSLDLTTDQSWTGSQRSTPVANTSGSFDMATGNNFNYTPSGNQALTFTNITAGQGGILYVVNSGHTITKHASVKVDANLLATVTAAGTYMLGYYAPTSAIIVVTNSLAVT